MLFVFVIETHDISYQYNYKIKQYVTNRYTNHYYCMMVESNKTRASPDYIIGVNEDDFIFPSGHCQITRPTREQIEQLKKEEKIKMLEKIKSNVERSIREANYYIAYKQQTRRGYDPSKDMQVVYKIECDLRVLINRIDKLRGGDDTRRIGYSVMLGEME
jgi:hypothetical protein